MNSHINLRRARTVLPLVALFALSGCFLLSPDTESEGGFELTIRAESLPSEALGRRIPADALLQDDVSRMTAFAVLRGYDVGENGVFDAGDTPVLSHTIELAIGPFAGGGRDLTGQFDFDRGPLGTVYTIEAELKYRPLGLDPSALDGTVWQGDLVLDPGSFSVDIEQLRLNRIGSTTNFTGSATITSVLSIGEAEEVVFDEPFEFVAADATFEIVDRYGDIDVLDDVAREEVEFRIAAELLPVTIFETAGVGRTNEVIVDFQQLAERGEQQIVLFAVPGDVDLAQRVEAEATVSHFAYRDGDDPSGPGTLEQTASAKLALRQQVQ